MVEGSKPELRLLLGDGGGRPSGLRELSTLNLLMASLRRFDMASGRSQPGFLVRQDQEFDLPFSPKFAGDKTPDIG